MELTGTIPALLKQNAAAKGNETILRKKDRGIWNTITWSELAARVDEIARGLRASGIMAGETVAILCDTRPELVYADLAILSLGCVSVAIDPDDEAPRVNDILTRTGAAAAIVQGEEQLDKVLGIRTACPALRRIVIIDMKGLREFQDPQCISLTGLVESGASAAAVTAVTADQPAVVLVPRTGDLQTLTHAEIMRRIGDAASSLGVRAGDERLAVLPMCDPAERIFGLYLSLATGVVSDYLENPETATENLREVKPTVFGANVEAWERLHARITALADAATPLQRTFYRWAMSGGGLAGLLVLPAVRAELGFGRLRVAFVGDGELSAEISQWAKVLGITVRSINPY